MGHISFVGKLDGVTLSRRRAGHRAGLDARSDGEALARLLADVGGSARPEQPRHARPRRQHRAAATSPTTRRAHERLIAKLEDADEAADEVRRFTATSATQGLFARNLFVGQRIPLAGVAHQNGTIRFGHDPKTSALDVNCKAHDVDNLYVVDGSFFPRAAP